MKNILIGITGGVDCYKTCDLIVKLKNEGFEVKVVATENALEFITPLTLQNLSHNKLYIDQFNIEWKAEHVSLAEWADVFVIAPTTANTISKIATGICDNLLTSVICAFDKKVVIAPAMNCNMWNNQILQENIKKIQTLKNYYIVGPYENCEKTKIGKMVEPTEIINFIKNNL